MVESNEEWKDFMKTVKQITQDSHSSFVQHVKKRFEDCDYTYSIYDDYKNSNTEKVMAYMLLHDINIFYYKEDYERIIFINFLRLCQVNNLDVKKYHDLFIKYDLSHSPIFEKYADAYVRPIIENDKLLWDVNEYKFLMFHLHNRTLSSNQKSGLLTEGEKIQLRNMLEECTDQENSSSDEEENSSDNEEEDSDDGSYEEHLDSSENILNEKIQNGDKIRKDALSNLLNHNEGVSENVSKKKREKRKIAFHLNNIISNNELIESVINKTAYSNIIQNVATGSNSSLDESLLNKFVSSCGNEKEEIKNLTAKVESMEVVIKHLLSELANRDEAISQKKELERSEKLKKNNEIQRNTFQNNKRVMYREDSDTAYFDSYNYVDIHRTMILDKVRTNSYYKFINKNKDLFKNKVVLDLGCGSSILSLFCSDFAKMVVGVDNAEKILMKAKYIVEHNQVKNVILCKGKLEDHDIYIDAQEKVYYLRKDADLSYFEKKNQVVLTKLKFDIIISEWMGYFLFYECMLDTILYARDHYLKEGGYLFPNKIHLYMAGCDDTEYLQNNIYVWDNKLYGKNFQHLKPDMQEFTEEMKLLKVDKNTVTTEIIKYATINMYTYQKGCSSYVLENFKIPLLPQSLITSLCFYFDCVFEASNNIVPTENTTSIRNDQYSSENNNDAVENSTECILTTSMYQEVTHWMQTLVHLYNYNYDILRITNDKPEKIEYLEGRICIFPQSMNTRNISLLVELKKNRSIGIEDKTVCLYNMD